MYTIIYDEPHLILRSKIMRFYYQLINLTCLFFSFCYNGFGPLPLDLWVEDIKVLAAADAALESNTILIKYSVWHKRTTRIRFKKKNSIIVK